jgi:hypothetical protein
MHVGLSSGQVGACLKELLVNFRRIDVDEQFAFADAGTNVAIPLF